ncbi:zinc finger, C3HC4 type [Dictyocaulus viviparus]|uniref:Zinc finger, C3HC4 type n=1 Tax=Dictyocaulus viviparus TaxID=29172 RepID=A0A0D8XDJ0_DICVI|nr:zinc finger, C3HC4 type [Dictyocaulus viviparus]
MTDIIRQVVGRLTARLSKNKYPVAHIEGAESVMIDSSVLCCPVCYNVFASAPSILQCGHTFCVKCLRNIATLGSMNRWGRCFSTLALQHQICDDLDKFL